MPAKQPTIDARKNQLDGLWYFTLVGANGERQTWGEGYSTKAACKMGIEDARRNMAVAKVVWRRS